MTAPAGGVASISVTTVLIVDDEPSVRRALRRLLELKGISVVEAGSAAAALAVAAGTSAVDAVVSDVVMPGVSGLDFYDELTRRAPHLAGRVVFLTGAADLRSVHDPIEARGVPLLSKMDDLSLAVDAVMIALLNRS